MPIKKRKNTAQFVFEDNGIIIVKTPAVCTRWDNHFRRRIVSSYVPPKSLRLMNEFQRNFVDNGFQDTVYVIDKLRVMVRQPTADITPKSHIVVLRTDIIDLSTNRRLFLSHDDPAMRMLITYSFLHQVKVLGIPKLDIAPYEPD